MINNAVPNNLSPEKGSKINILSLLIFCLLCAPATTVAGENKAPKFKKNTVIDFEEALVEGKSRKPYSAYLYQHQAPALQDLSRWQPDFSKQVELTKAKIGPSL